VRGREEGIRAQSSGKKESIKWERREGGDEREITRESS
jgi:hypothetical protein